MRIRKYCLWGFRYNDSYTYKRLTSLGVVQGSKYIIDPAKIGYDTCAYIGLTLKDDSRFEDVIEALKSIPEIVEVYCTNEAYDLL